MIVERDRNVLQTMRTGYVVRDDDGAYRNSLTFREVMALVAADAGRVRSYRTRCYSPYFYDSYLKPICDDHGIGYGTITGLQGGFKRPPLIVPCGDDEGPLGLTAEGAAILAEIRALVAA